MGSEYQTIVIINNDWCSLDKGKEASVRAGDMRATEVERVYARPLKSSVGLQYKITVGMEIVN